VSELLRLRTLNTTALGRVEVRYRKGYKYQLASDVHIYVGVIPGRWIQAHFIQLDIDGWLTIRQGYAWDGMSGAIDTRNSMLGSLVHDALYQLMRRGYIPFSHRPTADRIFYQILLAKGMWKWRAWYIYRTVSRVAAFAADPESIKPILTQ